MRCDRVLAEGSLAEGVLAEGVLAKGVLAGCCRNKFIFNLLIKLAQWLKINVYNAFAMFEQMYTYYIKYMYTPAGT